MLLGERLGPGTSGISQFPNIVLMILFWRWVSDFMWTTCQIDSKKSVAGTPNCNLLAPKSFYAIIKFAVHH